MTETTEQATEQPAEFAGTIGIEWPAGDIRDEPWLTEDCELRTGTFPFLVTSMRVKGSYRRPILRDSGYRGIWIVVRR